MCSLVEIESDPRWLKSPPSAGPQKLSLARSLDLSVMVQDSDLVRTLAAALTDRERWTTSLVTWGLEPRGPDGSMCVAGVLTLESTEGKVFAVSIPCLARVRPEQALESIIELVENCRSPGFVADVLRRHERVFVSPVTTSDAAHEAPLLTNFAREAARWSAIVAWHPQLAQGTSLVKFFPLSCGFFLSGKYLAVLHADSRQAELQFFEVDPADASLLTLDADLVEDLPLSVFADMLTAKVGKLYKTTTTEESTSTGS